jgi:glycosidase
MWTQHRSPVGRRTPPGRRVPSRQARGRRLLGAVVLAAGLVAGCGPGPSPSPSLPAMTPEASPGAIAVADRVPLAPDGAIDEAGLGHDSRDDAYRTPFGAVPAGTRVTIRLSATAGDLTSATLRVYDTLNGLQALIPMHVEATDRTAGEHGVDWWAATINTAKLPTVLTYRFIVSDGPATRYVEDDPPTLRGGGPEEGSDGGTGQVYESSIDAGWQIDVYDPAFTTPAWTHGATVYQIFPDRFANGDPSNDPTPDATPGPDGAARFRYGDVYGNPVLPKAWTDLPEGYCRAYQGVTCNEQPLGRDFFGGDLAGITGHLDDLAALGVTVIYLNPVFAAPSNHRYDTSSYEFIDPDLGTQAEFDALVAEAGQRGIRVLLDGVFNHVSSDSPWFDRERRFSETGACEKASSPYRSWFMFREPAANEPSPCAPSTKGGKDTYYQGWFGFDTIPELVETPAVVDLFTGQDGVARTWLRNGIAGWRLDVMDNLSHGFMRTLRDAVKAENPDALLLGEQWLDSSAWLLGDQADSTMNYRFRRAVIGLVNGDTGDLDGAISGLTPSQFASRMEGVREDYPAPAWESLLNLVDSHDTTRILWTLAPGPDNPAARESAAGLAEAKSKLRLVSALQLTWPGMASIYYGTEAGLTGQDDPDDRRPYPWASIDGDLQGWYRQLGQARLAHEALRTGDLEFLAADDDAGTLAYLRRTNDEAAVVALNLADSERTVTVDLTGRIPAGTALTDLLGGAGATAGGSVSIDLPARGVAILVTDPGTDLAPPAAPGAPTATVGTGTVDLAWTAGDGDTAGYRVWRSVLTGGGYQLVGTTDVAAYTDTTVRNGTRVHYVVTALDAAGNESARSPEVDALPQVELADARIDAPASLTQALSAVDPGTPIDAVVTPARDGAAAAGVGVRAQLGIGPADGDPADYAWTDMRFVADEAGGVRLRGGVRPEAEGEVNVVLRVSTDGGATWSLADRGGIVAGPDVAWTYRPDQALALTATPGADTTAPSVPTGGRIETIGDGYLVLSWDPVPDADLYRYEVLRSTSSEGEPETVGTAVDPRFTDNGAASGSTFVYRVVAVDTSFNRSMPSAAIEAQAELRPVDVTFTVSLPANTPAGDTIHIAGDFQGWNPGGTPMTKVDDRTWTITLPFTEGDAPQYKYTRGSWEAVEKDDACGELANRTIAVGFGEDGTMAVDDAVAKWRDLDQCP